MADNGSDDEEPDYMSEDFLKQCTGNDIRPSLIHNRADKRKHEVIKRQVLLNKSKEDREKERGTLKPLDVWYWPAIKKVAVEKPIDLEGYAKESTIDEDNEAVMLAKKRRTEYSSSDEESEEEEPVDDVPNEEKLESITEYLRTGYFYCVWCGTKYDNITDLISSCPGTTREDH